MRNILIFFQLSLLLFASQSWGVNWRLQVAWEEELERLSDPKVRAEELKRREALKAHEEALIQNLETDPQKICPPLKEESFKVDLPKGFRLAVPFSASITEGSQSVLDIVDSMISLRERIGCYRICKYVVHGWIKTEEEPVAHPENSGLFELKEYYTRSELQHVTKYNSRCIQLDTVH